MEGLPPRFPAQRQLSVRRGPELPYFYDLMIAKALCLQIPQLLLLRADEVIQ